jgi:hypothetical protein
MTEKDFADMASLSSALDGSRMLPSPAPELTLTAAWLPNGILTATLTGPASLKAALARSQEILNLAAENKSREILVNCLAVTGALSTFERYRLAVGAVQHVRSVDCPIPAVALVGMPPGFDGFGLLVAQNLGALALLFRDVQSALNWLEAVSERRLSPSRA